MRVYLPVPSFFCVSFTQNGLQRPKTIASPNCRDDPMLLSHPATETAPEMRHTAALETDCGARGPGVLLSCLVRMGNVNLCTFYIGCQM